jgi:hypothetical protein
VLTSTAHNGSSGKPEPRSTCSASGHRGAEVVLVAVAAAVVATAAAAAAIPGADVERMAPAVPQGQR